MFRSLAVRGRVDGAALDLARPDRRARRARLESAGTPIVLVDREHDALPAITSTTSPAAGWPAEHLLGLGHRRIAFVGDEEENPFGFDSSARRREGFEAALAAAGAPLRPEWILRGPHGRDAGRDVRRRAARARRAGRRPIFASSDVQAIGVLEAARAAGVPVPGRALGHRLRRRRGRGVRGAHHDHAVARGERRPRRRSAAACALRGTRREPALAAESRRAPHDVPLGWGRREEGYRADQQRSADQRWRRVAVRRGEERQRCCSAASR